MLSVIANINVVRLSRSKLLSIHPNGLQKLIFEEQSTESTEPF